MRILLIVNDWTKRQNEKASQSGDCAGCWTQSLVLSCSREEAGGEIGGGIGWSGGGTRRPFRR